MTDGFAQSGIDEDSAVPGSDVVVPPVDAHLSAGQRLAARRLEYGWSVEQVAGQLKMAPRQIAALEADQLDLLPNLTVARGFMRNYAKFLKLDAALLLTTVQTNIGSPIETIRQRRPLSKPFESTLPSMRTNANGRWLLGIVLLMIVGGAVWSARHWNWVEIVKPLQMLLQRQQPAAPILAAPGPTAGLSAPSTDRLTDLVGPEHADVAKVTAVTANKPIPDLTSAPVKEEVTTKENGVLGKVLKLNVRQDSWIEIKDKKGTILMSRLVRAGTLETFEVVEPVSLVVGNAAGVDATLQDTRLDLSASTSTNVARINLE